MTFIQFLQQLGNPNIKAKVEGDTAYVDITTRGLSISAYYSKKLGYGGIDFNGEAWLSNDGSAALPAELWSNILANCVDLMDF